MEYIFLLKNGRRGGFTHQTLWTELFSNIDFRVCQTFKELWFSYGGDFMGVVYAGGDPGEEVSDAIIRAKRNSVNGR
jgi:hypothetical protein